MEAGDVFRLIYFIVIVFIFFGSILRNILKSVTRQSTASNTPPSKTSTSDKAIEELLEQFKEPESSESSSEPVSFQTMRQQRKRSRRERQKELSQIKSRHTKEQKALGEMSEKIPKESVKTYAKLFQNQENVKQAFIMSEIFKRKY